MKLSIVVPLAQIQSSLRESPLARECPVRHIASKVLGLAAGVLNPLLNCSTFEEVGKAQENHHEAADNISCESKMKGMKEANPKHVDIEAMQMQQFWRLTLRPRGLRLICSSPACCSRETCVRMSEALARHALEADAIGVVVSCQIQ